MMWHHTEKQTTQRVLTHITCDICGKASGEGGDWPRDKYGREHEIEIEHKAMSHYGGSGSGERLSIDMCPDCFTDKLLPFLRSLGFMGKYEDSEY